MLQNIDSPKNLKVSPTTFTQLLGNLSELVKHVTGNIQKYRGFCDKSTSEKYPRNSNESLVACLVIKYTIQFLRLRFFSTFSEKYWSTLNESFKNLYPKWINVQFCNTLSRLNENTWHSIISLETKEPTQFHAKCEWT